jgi:hypothetical protein
LGREVATLLGLESTIEKRGGVGGEIDELSGLD